MSVKKFRSRVGLGCARSAIIAPHLTVDMTIEKSDGAQHK